MSDVGDVPAALPMGPHRRPLVLDATPTALAAAAKVAIAATAPGAGVLPFALTTTSTGADQPDSPPSASTTLVRTW